MRFKEYLSEVRFKTDTKSEITKSDIRKFEKDLLAKLKSKFGVTGVRVTEHFDERTNRKKDAQPPPVTLEETGAIMDKWFQENASLFKEDVLAVKENRVKKRGLKKGDIPDRTLEWVASGAIKDRSNFHVVMALGQEGWWTGKGKKGTAVLTLPSVIRTKNKKITRGEYYKVGGVYEYKGGK